MNKIKASDLASPRFKANPYPLYARLRAEAPVYRTTYLNWPAWLVTRYDDVLSVLKDERFAKDISAKMPWLPRFARPATRSMLNMDPPRPHALADLGAQGVHAAPDRATARADSNRV